MTVMLLREEYFVLHPSLRFRVPVSSGRGRRTFSAKLTTKAKYAKIPKHHFLSFLSLRPPENQKDTVIRKFPIYQKIIFTI